MSSKISQQKAAQKNKGKSSFSSPVAAPVSAQRLFRGRQAQIYPTSHKSIRVRHVERFASINGSVALTVNSYALQPGLVSSFPWLSNIANRYESYLVHRAKYCFRNKCATSFTGDVSLGVDYDAADGAPSSTIQMENWDDSVNGSPWQDIELECSSANLKKEKEYYTRRAALSSNLDIKTYDAGNFYVLTEGQASAALVGYVYLDYDIEFFTPQLNFDDVVVGGLLSGATSTTAALPFGTAGSFDAQSLGLIYTGSGTNSVVTFSYPGTYLLSGLVGGTGITASTATGSSGVTVAKQDLANAAGTLLFFSATVINTVANGTVTLSITGTTVSTGASLYIGVAPTGSLT